MITSLFRKSTPFNYGFVIITVLVSFGLYQAGHSQPETVVPFWMSRIGILVVIFASLFIVNFVVKKNDLSKDSTYAAFFYMMLLLFFPSLLVNPNLMLAGFFILLAQRRIISMHSFKATKEKIFDASLWIFVASLFHFWSIAFILLVFISIFFHVSRDYRNYILPFIACFAITMVFLLYAMAFDKSIIAETINRMKADWSIDYFTDNSQNIALSVYASIALFFLASMILTLPGRPLVLQASYKKIVASFLLGVFIFVVSPNKTNEVLIFTFAPLAFMATSHMELPQNRITQEITMAIFILCGIFLFFLQL
ncbi:MAG TPA: hypothetical protein VGB50_13330 [Flavobacterium sp.]|jgi:hypothetical protein